MKTRYFFLLVLGMVALPTLAQVAVGGGLAKGDTPSASGAKTAEAAIPWSELGAKAGAQYQGDGLAVSASGTGARLRCVFQKMEGEVTREGLWLTSTATPAGKDRFQVVARAVGRGEQQSILTRTGTVTVAEKMARFIRPEVVEEYSVSMDGVRQDFVVLDRPPGTGPLRVELDVAGAQAEAAADGARLVLKDSGRKLAYHRLSVVDAREKKLTARLEVLSPHRLAVVVEDADATYPVRIDPTFSDANWVSMNPGMPGANNVVYAAFVDAGGNLYIGGDFTFVGTVPANRIAKWNGSAWSALGSGMNGTVSALAVSGTNLYAGGVFTTAGGVAANYVARWNGSAWSALGSGMDNNINALAVSGTDLYAGGSFTTAGGVSANYIAKWNGSAWSALGSGVVAPVYALAVSEADLYVAGAFTFAGGVAANFIAKWNGGVWSALGSGLNSSVTALAVSGTELYAGGYFSTAGGAAANGIAKWNGSTWSALGSGVSGVKALAAIGPDLYAGGTFTTAGGVTANYVAKWNGSAWSAIDSGMNSWVYALAASGTNLYMGGLFSTAGEVSANYVAKWNGSAWSGLGPSMFGVQSLAVGGSELYVGGYFSEAGGVPASRIAKWNGSTWAALGSGVNSNVFAITVSGGDVYAAGLFTMAGGVAANRIAKWNGSTWSALGSGLNSGSYGYVSALAMIGTNLYAAGDFTTAGGVAANRIAKWDGSAWSALGSGLNGAVNALAVIGTDLYAGGYFTTAGGVSANFIAKWNGSAWSALGSGVNDWIAALAVSGTDLYAGGNFTGAGGVSANYLARWNGSAWSSLGSGMDNWIAALAVNGTDLYAGGSFTTAGGVTANYIAKWNGSAWSALGSGMDNPVTALAGDSSGHLFVAGNFALAGTTVSPFLAQANIAPEIAVQGNGVSIADGDATPGATDHTDFGIAMVSGGAVVRTFTIQNLGSVALTLSGVPKVAVSGTHMGDFAVTALPTSPVPPGGSTMFEVTFTPSASGLRTATLTIPNDDSDEGTFDFGIQGTGNTAPMASAPITDFAVNEDAAIVVRNLTTVFSDVETAAASLIYAVVGNTNTALMTATITQGTNLTLAFAADGNGTSRISVSATDTGGLAVTNTFTIIITPVNDAPTLAAIPNPAAILEDAGLQTIALSGISAGGGESQALTITATSSNPGLIPNPTVTYTSPATTGSLSYTPVANASGSTIIKVVVKDDGGTLNGGVDAVTNTFTVTVTPVNDAPSFVLPAGPSVPAGATWTARESSRNWSSVASSADGSKLVAAESPGLIYTSTDFGVTWTPRDSSRSWFAVASSSDGSKLVAVEGYGQIYTSTDSGVTWTAQVSDGYWYSVASSADGSKLVAVDYWGGDFVGGQIYTSTDSGVTWMARESERFWRSVASSADGTKLVAAVEGGQLYTSTDSGVTWTARESDRDWSSVASSADGSQLVAVVAYGGQIYTSTDSGATWMARESDRNWRSVASSSDGSKLVAVENGGQIYTSTDSGATWTPREGDRNWSSVSSSSDGSKLVAAVDGGQLYTSVGSASPHVLTVNEDSGAYMGGVGFATSISPGPADEVAAGQTVSFTVTNDNNALFTSQPAMAANGTLTFTPAPNATGTTTVSVVAQDTGGTLNGGVDTSAAQTFIIVVTPVNDAPTLAAIPNPAAILEDAGLQTIALSGISAGGGETQVLTVTATSSNPGLIPHPTVTYTSPNATGSLSYTPVANASGSAVISVVLKDDGGTFNGGVDAVTNTFTVTVTPVNDAPTLAAIPNPAAILEDAGLQTIALSGISAGGGETQVLTVTATSSNPGLIPNPTVTYTSPNATGSLIYTPVANASGSAVISVVVKDDGGALNGGVDAVTNTFTVTVTPVNDAPTLAAIPNPAVILEDAGLQTIALSGIGAGGGESQVLTVTATSSNPGLIPNPTVTYTSPNATGSLSYTPVANASGSAVISVVVKDNGGTLNGGVDAVTNTFTVTVTPVNDAPTLAAIPNPAAILEDAGLQTIALSGISAGGGESQVLTVTATSSNPGLIPNPTVTYTSPNTTGSLSYTPVANASGSTVIKVVVKDDGGTLNGGVDAVTNTFTVTVTPVNDAPALAAIPNPAAILEDAGLQTIVLGGISAGPGESQVLTVTATSSNPDLIPHPTVTYTSPGTGGSLTYTPVANASGSAVVSVVVKDDGGTANGGVDAVTNTFTVTVTSVNDAPTVAFTTNNIVVLEDSGANAVTAFATFSPGPANESAQTLLAYTLANNSNALFSAQPTIDNTGRLTFTPATNANGTATVTVIAQDNGGTDNGGVDHSTNTFTITVTPVNDAPTLAAIPNPVAILQDAGLQTLALSGISAGDGELQVLTVTATSSNPALIPNPAVTYTSPVATGSLSYTPVANASGSAVISVVVKDDGGTLNGGVDAVTNTFTVTVTPGITPPLIVVQPIRQTVNPGDSATFTVTATGGSLTYQWRKDGLPIAGETGSSLVLSSVDWSAGGIYSVLVTNTAGMALSRPASLLVAGQYGVIGWGYNHRGQASVPSDLTNVVALSAGDSYSLVLKDDGRVSAWGRTNDGVTMIPAGVSNAVAVAAGWYHALALRTNGTVAAWGNNGGGQLNLPAGLTNVVAISAGAFHSVALRSDGTLVGWGDNTYGQSATPLGLSNVVGVAAGGYFTTALKADGRIVAWGENSSRQTNVPPTLTNTLTIAAGTLHGMALKPDGTVAVWGDWGELNNGNTNVPAGLTDVVGIAAGSSHSLAFKTDGTAVGWGKRADGRATIPAGMTRTVALAGGANHSLALAIAPPSITTEPASQTVPVGVDVVFGTAATGTVPLHYQWRSNGVAMAGATAVTLTIPAVQLSDQADYSVVVTNFYGSVTSSVATLVVGLPAITTQPVPQTVNVGATATFSISASSPSPLGYQWRKNGIPIPGATGASVTITGADWSSAGTYSVLLTNAVGMTLSRPAGLLVAGQSRVVGWGQNTYGQTNAPPGLADAVAVTAGAFHTAALRVGGQVVSWGYNGNGETNVPTNVTNALAISSGQSHTVALRNDGGAVAWGWNSYGGATVPFGLSNLVAVAGGDGHSLGLRSDGTVVGWGQNNYAQTNVPPNATNIVAIAADGAFSMGLRLDGRVIVWGYGGDGQTNIPASVTNGVAIAAGVAHCVALRADGTVRAWGYNASGQASVPTGLSNVLAIAAGNYHTLAIKADGEIVAWGSNGSGQTNVPPFAKDAVAIDGGGYHSVALAAVPPAISLQPVSQAVLEDETVGFSVAATGTAPLAFQWFKNGAPLAAQTSNQLSLVNVQTSHAGSYQVIITNVAGSVTSSVATLMVTEVNDAPTLAAIPNPAAIFEDAGLQTSVLSGISAGGGESQVLTVTATSSNPGLIPNPTVTYASPNATGSLSYTPVANASGSAVIKVVVKDDGGTFNGGVDAVTNTFTVAVTPVNDAPTVALATNNVVVLEDSGPYTNLAFAVFQVGPPDEVALPQAITNVTILSVTNAGLFSVPPALSTNGVLTFTPATNANGAALVTFCYRDNGGTANDGVNKATNNFHITVTAVNDAPEVVAPILDFAVNEDAAPVVKNLTLNFNDVETPPASLEYAVVANTNTALLTATITQGTNLTLTFAPNENGTSRISVSATDAGGLSATNTFTVAVMPVNDAPTVALATNNVVVLEDSGSYTNLAFATFSPGPANESAQTLLAYTLSNNSNALFNAQPAIDNAGRLTFSPATNAAGAATVTVIAQDSGGTTAGGVDKTTNTFTITVAPVNDAPTAAFATNHVVVLEDSGANAVPAFAAFSPGPANESAQTLLAYTLANNSNALFSAQPAIDNSGRLTFTPATNGSGAATVTVVVQDSGGTADGGVDKSTNTFTITIAPVNDAPSFFKGADQTVLANAGTLTVPAWATAISAGPANESGQLLNFVVTNSSNSLFAAQPAIAPNGTLTFTPATNALGTATVTVRLHDDGGTLGGGVDTSAPQTFTITIAQPAGHTFWAMGDNRYGQLGDGTTIPTPPFGRPRPVRILSEIAAAAAGGDAVFGHSLLVKRDGTLLTVGANHVGQLGDGTTVNRSNLVQIATAVATPAAGALHSLFIKRDDTLWAMGGNASGQLGDGTLNNRSNPVLVATAVATAAGGGGHSLFVKRDSTLWAMGGNASGQLGDGTTVPRLTPVPVVSGVMLAAAGEAHSLFVKTDGSLWAMGRNLEGQLGDGSNLQRNAPVLVANGVTAVAAGSAHSLFIKTDGTLWAMGYNGRGQLGIGTTNDHNAPVFVTNGVIAVAAGADHSLFVKTNGTLWAMGWNAFGQLGDGTFIDRHTPVRIPVDSAAGLASAATAAPGTAAPPAVPGVLVVVPVGGGSHSLFLADVPTPELLCPTNLVARNDAGVCGARVRFTPIVRDGAGTLLVCVPPSGSLFPVGTSSVTCTLFAGSPAVPLATCGFTVTVIDREPPRFVIRPTDRQIKAGESTDPAATGRPTATDNCTAAPRIAYTDVVLPGGSATVVRVIKRTWLATDAAGNTASFLQTITVTAPPRLVIHCPPDVRVQCGDPLTTDKTGKATATTATGCGPVNLTFKDTTSDGVIPVVKVITRTWTATDRCGNRATCSQTITVVDSQAPKILSLTATPATLSPANNKMVTVKVKRVVADRCHPDKNIKLTLTVKVTDPAGLDGKTYYVVKSLEEVTLRAKKGVTYTLTLTARDPFGNTSAKSITVPVK